MADTAEINSRNFIQKIKGMEKAERNRLKLADILKWIVDFDEDATQKSMANDIALLFTNFKLLSATVASNEKEIADVKAKNIQLQEEVETLKAERSVIESELKGTNPDIKTIFLQAAANGTLNEPVLSVQNLGKTFSPLQQQVSDMCTWINGNFFRVG